MNFGMHSKPKQFLGLSFQYRFSELGKKATLPTSFQVIGDGGLIELLRYMKISKGHVHLYEKACNPKDISWANKVLLSTVKFL